LDNMREKNKGNQILISVIIPIYNNEKYVFDCLNSLEAQTYPKEFFEVIIIDDASTDNTLLKVKTYKSELKLQIDTLQGNSGPGVARNKGIELSKGDFILFLDSDDLLVPNAIELLLNKIKEKDPDLITYNWTYLSDVGDNGNYKPRRRDLDAMPLEKDTLLKHYLGMNMDGSVIYTIMKKSLFDDYDIKFGRGYHEDIAVILEMYYVAQKINKMNKVLYIKRNIEGSIINTLTKRHVDGYLGAWPTILQFLRCQKGDKALDAYMPYYFRGISGLICILITRNMKFYSKRFEKRVEIYSSVLEVVRKDSNLKPFYAGQLPNKTEKDKITQLFFACMARSDIPFDERARLFEQKYSFLNQY
jgi:poly(ribitol-phosphate) beta-N-acetylglucosaminyltransferase